MKVLSYNINEGGQDRLAAIAALIRAQQPDAVALQEATSRANVLHLARDLRMDLVFGEANSGDHIAWLSRLSILRQEHHRPATLSKALLAIEVTWGGAPVRLWATHLASRHDRQTPEEEVGTILAFLRADNASPHLLVGDFNALRPGDPVGTPPPGVAKRGDALDDAPRRAIGLLLAAGYVDCYRALHPDDPGYTYPSATPWLRLDYAFASPALAASLQSCDVLPAVVAAQASDHCPIRAAFD